MERWLLYLEFVLFALFFLLGMSVSAKRQRQPLILWIGLFIFIPWLFFIYSIVFSIWDETLVHLGLWLVVLCDIFPFAGWLLALRSWRIEQEAEAKKSSAAP